MQITETTRLTDVRYPLRGRTAVVTGAASGIGTAIADSLLDAGADVLLVDRDRRALAEVARRLDGDGRVLAQHADVTDPDALRGVRRLLHDRIGPADLVVANAGVMLGGGFGEADERDWRRMIDVNLGGMMHTARAFLPDLLGTAEEGGPTDLVFVGSIASEVLFPRFAVYSATQAAITQLSRTLRAEVADTGVRVKLLTPGVTVTALGEEMTDEASIRELRDLRAHELPLTPEDVASTVTFAAGLPAHVNIAELTVIPTRHGALGAAAF